MRSRFEIRRNAVPTLPSHVRLQFDELRRKWVVLAPERVLWPDDVSVDILLLCDGALTVEEIIGKLAKDYDAPPHEIQADVLEFLQDWADRRLLEDSR